MEKVKGGRKAAWRNKKKENVFLLPHIALIFIRLPCADADMSCHYSQRLFCILAGQKHHTAQTFMRCFLL